jgi:hypothetical protein
VKGVRAAHPTGPKQLAQMLFRFGVNREIRIAGGLVLGDEFADPFKLCIAIRRVPASEVFGNLAQSQVLLLHPVPNHIGTNRCAPLGHREGNPGWRQIGKHNGGVVGIACRTGLQHRLQILFEGGVGQDFFFRPAPGRRTCPAAGS